MKWGLPHLRLAGLALPLLTTGCMSDMMPGADAPDPSCVLLCALTRSILGEPAPRPVAAAATPAATKLAAARPVRKRVAHVNPLHGANAVAAPPARPQTIVARVNRHPVHSRATSQVSVVPQNPSRADAPTPVAIAPAPPVAAAPPPIEAPRSLSQAIPGSAGIMVPSWQTQ